MSGAEPLLFLYAFMFTLYYVPIRSVFYLASVVDGSPSINMRFGLRRSMFRGLIRCINSSKGTNKCSILYDEAGDPTSYDTEPVVVSSAVTL